MGSFALAYTTKSKRDFLSSMNRILTYKTGIRITSGKRRINAYRQVRHQKTVNIMSNRTNTSRISENWLILLMAIFIVLSLAAVLVIRYFYKTTTYETILLEFTGDLGRSRYGAVGEVPTNRKFSEVAIVVGTHTEGNLQWSPGTESTCPHATILTPNQRRDASRRNSGQARS